MSGKCKQLLNPIFRTSVLAAGLASGYYHRAFAGTCVSTGPGTYLCSDPADSATDSTQTINTGSPLTITTIPGFGINVPGGGITYAFIIHGTGGTSFTDINESSITGPRGISAGNSGSGNLLISSNGSITGTSAQGIVATNSGSDLIISVADVNGGSSGFNVMNDGSGTLSISSSGTISATGIGILATNHGSDLIISVADVSSGSTGISVENHGSGMLSISSSGLVTGTSSSGINARNHGSDLIISVADVSGGQDGIYARNNGSGTLSISSSGSVSGTSRHGINAINHGSETTIDIGSSGNVWGSIAGINALSDNGQPITISTSGRVSNLSGSPPDYAIISGGGPTTLNLNSGSVTTGLVLLDDFDDTVTLKGTLNGSALLMGGDDTFIQTGGSTLTGQADGGSGVDTLGFDDIGTVDGSSLGTKYLNFENLAIFGGTNILTGSWNFTGGSATVHAGNLYLNGTLTMPLTTVEAGALLGGSGSIIGDLKIYGTLSPGNSIDTFTVNGSVDFMPVSTFEVELALSGLSDRLVTSGQVSINESMLSVSLQRGLYQDGKSWQLISAEEGIVGRFSSVQTNFNSATISLVPYYAGSTMGLQVDRIPYNLFATSPNGEQVGIALDSLLPIASGSMANLMLAMDYNMNSSQIGTTLNGLSPEIYTSFLPSAMSVVHTFDQVGALRQLETSFPVYSQDAEELLWSVWGRALGGSFEQDGDGVYSGYELEGEGFVLGADRLLSSKVRVGVMLGHQSGDLSWSGLPGSGSISSKHIGLYASGRFSNFYLDARLGYTSLTNSATRTIVTPALSTNAYSGFDTSGVSGSMTSGYDFDLGVLKVGPVVSLSYLSLDQDGFRETGGSGFAVDIDSKDADVFTGSAGIRMRGVYQVGSWRFKPMGEAGMQYRSGDDPQLLDASFTSYSDTNFSVTGVEQDETVALARLGFVADYGNSLSLYLDGSFTMGESSKSQLLSAGLVWKF